MTEERALALCSPGDAELEEARQSGLEWSDADQEYAQRELRRSVRYIAQAADLMSREHLLLHMDDLPNMASVGQAPKMETLFTALHEAGFAAARVPDIDPFFVTDAPLEQVLETVRGLV
jgi:tRNA G26 N,N-dimethylase Trm1